MKIFKTLPLIALLASHIVAAQTALTFTGFIQRLNAAAPETRSAMVDSFMTVQSSKGFPVTDDSSASFVYRGSVASSIVVTGDQTLWSTSGQVLTNVQPTDLYYQTRKFESDARIDYKLIKDGVWILDPLNQHSVSGGLGPNSELAMPAYVQPTEIIANPAIPHGTVSSFLLSSAYTGNTRTIQVYLPPGYNSTSTLYPSLYIHDGPDYINLGSMANILDNLIEAKKIQPLICVYVPPGSDRAGEYRTSKITQFTNLMIKELVPRIDSAYRTDARAEKRGTMGSSDGGHIALYMAVNYSDTFVLVGGQSSTITDLFRTPIQSGPKVPVKFYLDVGTYDIVNSSFVFLTLNRDFRDLLISKGYDVTYAEYHEGHSWGNWRAHIDDILKTLYPAIPTQVKVDDVVPVSFRVLPAFPNPFNPTTTIQYELHRAGSVSIRVLNILGAEVQRLSDEYQPAGLHEVRWDASKLSSGTYFLTIETAGSKVTQRIALVK